MILGISIPKNAKIINVDDKVLISFDEKETKTDLWKGRFELWLTEGRTRDDFIFNDLINKKSQAITITHDNQIKMK